MFDDVEYLMNKMQRLQSLLLNKDVVSLRVVTTPERIVINEAKRNFTCLYLYRYNVDAILVNHVYPEKAMEGYFSKWLKMQENSLKEISESFSEVPRFYLELQPKELRTVEVLREAAELLFGETDPNEVLFQKEIYKIDKEAKCLSIYLPFAEKKEMELGQDKNEIIVGVKNEYRKFPMPAEFQEGSIASAKFQDGYLNITFSSFL